MEALRTSSWRRSTRQKNGGAVDDRSVPRSRLHRLFREEWWEAVSGCGTKKTLDDPLDVGWESADNR